MKFGIAFANVGPFVQPENAAFLAKACEDRGIESLWTVEHVVVPAGYQAPYPYSSNGKMPGSEDVPIPDPLIWLSPVRAMFQTRRQFGSWRNRDDRKRIDPTVKSTAQIVTSAKSVVRRN